MSRPCALSSGGGEVLLLQGQWLRDGDTYGAPPIKGDPPREDRISGREDPFGFPSDAFTLVMTGKERSVLRVHITGSYLKEEPSKAAIPHRGYMGQVARFSGSIENLQAALDQAARTQGAKKRRERDSG